MSEWEFYYFSAAPYYYPPTVSQHRKLTSNRAVALPAYQDYTVRAKASELILAASGARTGISEKFQSDPTPTTAGAGITIPIVGKLSFATVGDGGTIVVNGDTTSTSTGQAITITVTPTYSTLTGTITWSCVGSPAKYMPATCR